jgi:glycosyltransferase involved in cell wall biosynthesis
LYSYSIVVPLYNKASHIRKTLLSALNQKHRNFEIIVVDDGSKDYGADIVRQIDDDRVKLIQQKNQGVSVARNIGIKNASNEIIAFLDADDEWKDDHLLVLDRLAAKFQRAGAYATAYMKRKNNESWIPDFKDIPSSPWEGIIPNYFKSVAMGPEVMWTSAVSVRKRIFKKVGYFEPGMRNGQDADMWIRIAMNYLIAFSWKVTAVYNLDTKNSTVSRAKDRSHFKSHYFLKWPRMKTKKYSYLNEYIAKKQLILLTELYLAGYRKRVRSTLASVKTKLYKWAKWRLYIKTFINKKNLRRLRNIKKRLPGGSRLNSNKERFV